ncbi:MAG: hypothetical protein MJE68_15175 [Proteobacteria bacterium]|nr:hypothetical protein [Pseudomonadota bacterium]
MTNEEYNAFHLNAEDLDSELESELESEDNSSTTVTDDVLEKFIKIKRGNVPFKL